ncbi:MAG: hypothetical protein ACYC5A_09990 [Thermoleophilia bacterium]
MSPSFKKITSIVTIGFILLFGIHCSGNDDSGSNFGSNGPIKSTSSTNEVNPEWNIYLDAVEIYNRDDQLRKFTSEAMKASGYPSVVLWSNIEREQLVYLNMIYIKKINTASSAEQVSGAWHVYEIDIDNETIREIMSGSYIEPGPGEGIPEGMLGHGTGDERPSITSKVTSEGEIIIEPARPLS